MESQLKPLPVPSGIGQHLASQLEMLKCRINVCLNPLSTKEDYRAASTTAAQINLKLRDEARRRGLDADQETPAPEVGQVIAHAGAVAASDTNRKPRNAAGPDTDPAGRG